MRNLNDAQQSTLMPKLGTDLPFPDECMILSDKIYILSNRHPIMTPYSAVQMRQRNAHQRRQHLSKI